jgi:primosomal protein N' (replication factor Y) (superfamily II helicase)
MYGEILFQQKVGQADTLTYEIPNEAKIGQAVKVKIRGKEKSGIIWAISDKKPSFKTLMAKINEPTPLLSENQIEIVNWMSKYYFAPLFKVLKLFIPKRNLERKEVRSKAKDLDQIIRSKELNLTDEQQKGVETILKSKKNNFLIHGVTGSGKTEVYSRIAKESIKKNKQVLFLVPEISLTTQMINYFEQSTGITATVINSKLSEGERYRAWESIWKDEAKLVIGSRSAIFAPFQSLDLIIVDEEHEHSYKQDNSPRYTTHKVAEKIQQLSKNTKIVLGSATPSVETAELLKDSTIKLQNRIGNKALPDIEIVDLREEFQKGNYSIFSDRLREELIKTLESKQQAILFLNRRGSASSMVCRDCGFKVECDSCELPMTYHAKTLQNPSLICHHCGKITPPPAKCPNCKGINIKFLGIGTQRIESEVIKEFPNARTLRADKDTTSTKTGFHDIYKAFKNHEADILIGTQMIAKGLHLPKVNLVGVVLSDIGLNIPDFRTAERNFQLMTQVSGRAGRGKEPGKVIIQTYSPDNTSLLHTKSNNYAEFFNFERTQRKLLSYPPFGKLTKIVVEETSLQKCKDRANQMERNLWKIAREQNFTDDLEINIYPAYIARLRGKYRFIILIKSKSEKEIIHKVLEKLEKEDIMDPGIKIDIDPVSTT